MIFLVLVGCLGSAAAGYMAEKVITETRNKCRKIKSEATKKALDSKMNKAFQDLKNKMKALHEDFRQLQESMQDELQPLRAELEKKQGKKMLAFPRALESILKKTFQQLSQRIETLKENVQKWRETTERNLQLLRAYLEMNQGSKEEEIAWHLESMLNKNHQELSQKIQTLKRDVQEWSDLTKYVLQPLRAELEKKQDKEDEIASVLKSMLKKNHRLLSQRTPTLEEDIQKYLEATKGELRFRRAQLKKDQGNSNNYKTM